MTGDEFKSDLAGISDECSISIVFEANNQG
jgi:hypothetical protein